MFLDVSQTRLSAQGGTKAEEIAEKGYDLLSDPLTEELLAEFNAIVDDLASATEAEWVSGSDLDSEPEPEAESEPGPEPEPLETPSQKGPDGGPPGGGEQDWRAREHRSLRRGSAKSMSKSTRRAKRTVSYATQLNYAE